MGEEWQIIITSANMGQQNIFILKNYEVVKWSKNENMMNGAIFVILLGGMAYFIYLETWLWPIKILIFVLAFFVLKSAIFSKKF